MGRVKEIFMEVQEMYDGEVPANFDYDAYLNMRVEQIAAERESKINKFYQSVVMLIWKQDKSTVPLT